MTAKPKRPPRIKSTFAILDVLSQRDGELYRRVRAGEEFPVVIRGKIVRVFGNHDGTSREYEIDVEDAGIHQ